MSEHAAVRDPLIRYAAAEGWEPLPTGRATELRGGPGGRFFTQTLTNQLLRLNPGVLDAGRAAEVVRKLNLLPATIEGNRDALAWLRGENTVFVPGAGGGRERAVTLIDFDRPDRNEFHVTAEWTQTNGPLKNRADAALLINGIPVSVAETKSAHKPHGLEEGMTQIRRYHTEIPDLFASSQLFEVTELLGFYYGGSWATTRRGVLNWRDEMPASEGEGGGHRSFERKVRTFFERGRFLRVLRDYVVFLTKDDRLTKFVLRQHQSRAVEKVLDRVREPHKRRGLVWHTQGSGKTLTMVTVANRLLKGAAGTKPTVLMLVDRTELEANLFKSIEAHGIGTVEVAQSKRDLMRLLRGGYRGLIVSMIHKFDGADADANAREDVIVLVDEAHRTTGGDLGNFLLAAVPNATLIGFTGTPIDRLYRGEGTFKVFGGDDAPRGYLDKYGIAESVADGTTVKLNYAVAPARVRVLDRETLDEEFLKRADAEGLADVEELNAVLDRAVKLKEVLMAPSRMAAVAEHAARHFRENVEPMGFKAFLVAVDRTACCLYKQELDKHLPPEWSAVVISSAPNDDALLKRRHLSSADEKALRTEFVKPDGLPKVLIVTEKLLTGFDAPLLYAMYLDKPMRDHVLLQAIARVNRPYTDEGGNEKPCGFVLDYIGIFEDLEKALAFDADEVGSVIQNIDDLRGLFRTMMAEQAPEHLILPDPYDDRDAERAILKYGRRADREAFYKFFKQVQAVYDILSPDAALRPYIDDYGRLAKLYLLVRKAYRTGPDYTDREFAAKTRTMLRESFDLTTLEPPGAIHTLGAAELEALKRGAGSGEAKVLNLRKAIADAVRKDAATQPFLVPIGERAEALAERYEDRQITTQQALDGFHDLAEAAVNGKAEREQLGLNANEHAILLALRPPPGENDGGDTPAPDAARRLNGLFEQFPDHRWDSGQQAKLRAQLYRALRDVVGPKAIIQTANTLLKLDRV